MSMIGRPTDRSRALDRGELTDPSELERQMAEEPDGTMRRRDFLARTAIAAGGVTLASTLPANELVAEAARRTARRKLPTPRNMPVDTFVVLMMENRSFDHYFGWHPKADGKNKGLKYPDAEGNKIPTYRLTPDFQGCGHPDPDHGWTGGRWQWNGGKNNRFVTGNSDLDSSDDFAIGYYLKKDVTDRRQTLPTFRSARLDEETAAGASVDRELPIEQACLWQARAHCGESDDVE